MTIIMRIDEHGNLNTFGKTVIQSDINGNYKFSETSITVPKIIEYPPDGYRNYFVENTSVKGYLDSGNSGNVSPATEEDRTSDFINVEGWGNAVTRFRYKNLTTNHRAWIGIAFYDTNKNFIRFEKDDYVASQGKTGDHVYEHTFPVGVSYIRVSANFYDHPITELKISVEKGTIATAKHYLAFEDLPLWATLDGELMKFFNEGIVIKGVII